MKVLCSFFLLIARLCIAAIFIFAGVGKFLNFEQTSNYMAAKGFSLIPLFLVGAALIELIGGLLLALGLKTRLAALALLLFLIPTTALFHDFWSLSGAEQSLQQVQFLKNLAIFGGLLYVTCQGPGGCAWDACCRSRPALPEEKSPEEVRKQNNKVG